MEHSKLSQELIERQCRNVERKDFSLDKKLSEELIMKTYDLFGIARPKSVVWFDDLTSAKWNDAAWSASSAGSARSARSARSAWSASSASSAWSASSAGSAMSARSAWSASSARSAMSARSAWSALDYDFDFYVIAFEYTQNQDGNQLPNENDKIYLEYCELLMQAKEAGLGYRIEWEDTLYLVPSPVIRLNEDTPPQFHSDQLPAIQWKNGEELYYLDGVNLSKEMWQRIISKEMTFSEIMKIEISDQRTVALKYNPQAIIKENAVLVDKSDRGNELYLIQGKEINTLTGFADMYFLKMTCPTGRIFIEGVPPEEAKKNPKADDMQALLCGLLPSEYYELTMES